MIRFENLTKSFWVQGTRKIVIDNLNSTLPTGKSLALLGRNGAGKSTLMQIIAGTMRPDHGSVFSDGTISWPVGFGGSFHPDLTGAQNVRFVARTYGVDTQELQDFVEDFAELGEHFHMPVRNYSSGMKSRLTFGASMGVPFDTYLVDEVTSVGDAVFRRKSRAVFEARMQHSSAVLVSHEMGQVRAFCDAGIVLSEGRLQYFDDLNEAIGLHLKLLQEKSPMVPVSKNEKHVKKKSRLQAAMLSGKKKKKKKFIIIGLPRSGTTYLMTLLNAHRKILCAGEQFNPYEIIDVKSRDQDPQKLCNREQTPRAFSKAFFEQHADGPHECVGYKFMIGHNVRMLGSLPDTQGISLIYLHRRNKLAQVSSLIKANQSHRWAQEHKDAYVDQKIRASPQQISQHWHEISTYDFLFSDWFERLPQKKIKLEYRTLFHKGFEKKICNFLGVDHDPKMKSPLVKQGSNTILDRFENPVAIRDYFTALGHEDWLGSEI